jgi:ribose-phosphate pyrophosphokinase
VDYFNQKKLDMKKVVVVSPDAGGAKMATRFANSLGCKLAIIHKTRAASNKKQTSTVSHVVGDVKGKTTILYDDLIDTAGSVCKAKEALIKNGADPKNVYLVSSHPVFSGHSIANLKKAAFKEVVVTDTIPVPKEKQFKDSRFCL